MDLLLQRLQELRAQLLTETDPQKRQLLENAVTQTTNDMANAWCMVNRFNHDA